MPAHSPSTADSAPSELDYQLLQQLDQQPVASQRTLATRLGVSVGKVNFCLRALVDKGWVKAQNFRRADNKWAYAYLLTPHGMGARLQLTREFLARKEREYEALAQQISALRHQLAEEPQGGLQSDALVDPLPNPTTSALPAPTATVAAAPNAKYENTMNILITGGAGFIGSWLLESLAAEGHDITVLDSLSPQVHGPGAEARMREAYFSQPGRRLVVADVRDRETLDELLGQAEAVVHLAAETGTGQSMYQIAHYVDVNVTATATLLELIGTRHRHIRKLVLASSRSVYGEGAYRLDGAMVSPASRSHAALSAGQWDPTGPGGEPLQLMATPEDAPLRPASIYAATKRSMEEMGRIFSEAYAVPTMALRFQNVYGERQSLLNPYTGILSIFSNRMREHLPINVFEDGLESRDFVHVSDVVRSISLSLTRDLAGFHTLNIGAGVPTSVIEITQALAQRLNSRSRITVTGDFRVGDIRHCYADVRLARAVLGFEPAVSLAQGLDAFCDWVRTQAIEVDQSGAVQQALAGLGLGKAKA